MAIYVLNVKIVGRSKGHSALAAAAYRAGERLEDMRDGSVYDYTARTGVIHSEILLPKAAPARLADRQHLWNEVERREKRPDSQLARDFILAVPVELDTLEEQTAVVRGFLQEQFVSRGMIADFALHDMKTGDGRPAVHAHVMLTMRAVGPDGFGNKVRQWNAAFATDGNKNHFVAGANTLRDWRKSWEMHANQALEAAGSDERIDHRTLKAQREEAVAQGDFIRADALNREPQPKLGAAKWMAARMEGLRDNVKKSKLSGKIDQFRRWVGVEHRNAVRGRAQAAIASGPQREEAGAAMIARLTLYGRMAGHSTPDAPWPDYDREAEA